MSRQSEQRRGDLAAYRRYLAGMDASMRQKVALTAAHLLCEGSIADMGMGSGAGSDALAALYPALRVVGVDLNPTMVSLAKEQHQRANLEFVVGDIAASVFPPASLDGIFDSSVLHHVTSFGGYDYDNATRALTTQVEQLRARGVLIVRDFLDPGPGAVLLDLPADDGDAGLDPRTCSTARLFERFALEFRSLSREPGFPYECLGPISSSLGGAVLRYRLSRKHAVEFVLRKDYRADWESEVKEEYTYFTQKEFEALFVRLGMRLLASTPIWNPWIVRHRFSGKFEWRDVAGRLLDWPATNYIIVGERVPATEGVRFEEGGAVARGGFLSMEHYRHGETGLVMDLVRRPHLTIDVLPYFETSGELYVLARKGYPRPLLHCARRISASLDGGSAAGYVSAPLYVSQADKPVGQTVEEALAQGANLDADEILGFHPGATYYPSPGGVQEEVRSIHVEVRPVFVEQHLANQSGFSTSGMVRAIEARQLLRAAQVGGLPDARLELNVYQLLRARGLDAGPWIGEAITPTPSSLAPSLTTMDALRRRPPRRVFRRASPDESTGFLELHSSTFRELDATGQVIAERALEFVTPRRLGLNTIAAAPLCVWQGEVYLGIDDFDLPAAQCFNGNSDILIAPAYRLPREVASPAAARAFMLERLAAEFGLKLGQTWDLGGPYYPSPGLTPEAVYPVAVEVLGEVPAAGHRKLYWVAIRDALQHQELLVDGHLRILALRAAHAVGLLGSTDP